ncbi:aldehyde dehydrogenase family protein [Micromonospora sp. LOL_023]|uniref:aldehyde dehydrogenase family protein n=1 Tax=Micromonospora sp. LOL_023 TaxID=3345418 RepID=UPI003A875595
MPRRSAMAVITRPADPTDLLRPGILVGGQWRDTGTGGQREHVDPGTGRVQQVFALAGAAEVADAVAAARAALPGWRRWPTDRRREVLTRLGDLIRANAAEFAAINALEVGTPAALSLGRYTTGQTFFDYYAGWLDKATGDSLRMPGALDLTLLEPVGVVGAILTWNHPLANIQTTVAPALAAGCTVIVKPPEQAPFAALRFGRMCAEAGLPPGVVNVLPGGPAVGDALVRHPDIDKIGFVGGPATASRIQAAAAPTLKPLLLELGGKSASLVFPDADLDRACRLALLITANSGQGCTIPTRMFVHDDVYDQVLDRLVDGIGAVTVGDPFDPAVRMGPLIDAAARDRVVGVIDRARRDGAGDLVLGGHRPGGELADGCYVAPTVFSDVDPHSELATEEIFGPVLSVCRFHEEAEAVEAANASRYGLAGYVHTRDVDRALRVASALDVGNVGVNGAGAPAGPFAPFGGVKQSGYGKVGGLAGLLEFSRIKNVLLAVDE